MKGKRCLFLIMLVCVVISAVCCGVYAAGENFVQVDVSTVAAIPAQAPAASLTSAG